MFNATARADGSRNLSTAQWGWTRLALVMGATAAVLLLSLANVQRVMVAYGALAVILVVLRRPVVGLYLLAFTIPWGSTVAVPVGGFPLSPTEPLIALIVTAWVAVAIARRERVFSTTVWLPYLAIFIGAISLSATQAQDWHASVREIVKWIEMGALFLAATSIITTRRHVSRVAAALVLGGVSEALLGFFQAAEQAGPSAFGAHRLFFRSYGTFDQPNPYAGYLNMVIPLAFTMSCYASSRRDRWLYRCALGVMLGALVASQSRGALLALLVAGAVVLSVMTRPVARAVGIGVVGVIGAALAGVWSLIPASLFDKPLSAVGLGGVSFGHVTDANFSAIERAAHWLAGVRMFADHPLLGVGIGNYGSAYPHYHPRGWYASLEHAHNYYINIAAESGLAGLSAYLLLAGSALWYSYAVIRQVSDRLAYAVALGVLGALSATDFHNLFDVLYVHGLAALLGILVALLPASLNLDWSAQHGGRESVSSPSPVL